MLTYIQLQSREIETLKAEIYMLKRKDAIPIIVPQNNSNINNSNNNTSNLPKVPTTSTSTSNLNLTGKSTKEINNKNKNNQELLFPPIKDALKK